jgi:hypothetical protein
MSAIRLTAMQDAVGDWVIRDQSGMRIATINPALPNAESWARRLADEVERKPLRVNLDRSKR